MFRPNVYNYFLHQAAPFTTAAWLSAAAAAAARASA